MTTVDELIEFLVNYRGCQLLADTGTNLMGIEFVFEPAENRILLKRVTRKETFIVRGNAPIR